MSLSSSFRFFFPLLGLLYSALLYPATAAEVQVVQKKESTQVSRRKVQQGTAVTQNQATVSRRSQKFLQDFPHPPERTVTDEDDDPLATLIAYGWQEYRLENYARAKAFFSQGVESGKDELKRSASYGLAYTLLQLDNTDAALPLLQRLLKNEQDEQLSESMALTLAPLLFERGDRAALESLLPKLPSEQQDEWRQKITEVEFQRDLLQLKETAPEKFMQKYHAFLSQCRHPEPFFQTATHLALTNPALAKQLFTTLGRCHPENQHWQERIMREQLNIMSDDELFLLLSGSKKTTLTEVAWNSLLTETLWQRIDQAEQEDPEYDRLVSALYNLTPGDNKAATLAAWSCYHRAEYACAKTIFSDLFKKNGSDDALKGLVYTMQKLGEESEAIDVLSEKPAKTQPFNQLRHDLHATLGGRLYRKEQYEKAAAHLEQALSIQPDDTPLTTMLLWSRYHLGETEPLAEFLWQQYIKKDSATEAKSLADILENLHNPVFTKKVMAAFAGSSHEKVRKIAGDFAFKQGHPVLANQTYQGKETAYAGCANPELDTVLALRHKNGDPGTSRLAISALVIEQRFSVNQGKTWSISIAPLHIDSGTIGADLPVGSAFQRLQGKQGDAEQWQNHTLTYGWRFGLHMEGETDWDLVIGTTPLNGVVTPAVVGKIEARGQDWVLAAERDSMRDSMLSWVGQADPYSGREWGRVVETSLFASKTLSFAKWWLSLEGKYGWYHGENVEENNSLTGSVSAGYTTDWKNYQRSAGVFLFGRGFRRNSDFFTFGHGGYYSPEQQVIAGPFIRLHTMPGHYYWLDASLSAGVNYRKTGDAPHYAELGELTQNVEEDARHDLLGTYTGERKTGLGVDARVRGLLPISQGWFVGGEAAINNVSDFTEWQLAVVLRYRFGEGMGLGQPERNFLTGTDLVR